jgi:hypothetical protein
VLARDYDVSPPKAGGSPGGLGLGLGGGGVLWPSMWRGRRGRWALALALALGILSVLHLIMVWTGDVTSPLARAAMGVGVYHPHGFRPACLRVPSHALPPHLYAQRVFFAANLKDNAPMMDSFNAQLLEVGRAKGPGGGGRSIGLG